MIHTIKAEARHGAKYEWLNTFYLFSFANYFDPTNLQFGVLRVFNDDTINAYSGFDEHGHEDMEIVTIMLSGQLTHRDSLGNTVTLKAGEVQRMSAGTGVVHAEKNLGDEPVHLYQLWFLPEREQLTPSYEQKDFSYLPPNILVPIAAKMPQGEALHISADATVYLLELEETKEVRYDLGTNKGMFVYVQEGRVHINNKVFSAGDQARIEQETSLVLRAEAGKTKLVCIDVGGFESGLAF